MARSNLSECQKLARQIEELEDTLHSNAVEGRIASIQTGSETTGFFTPSEAQIRQQLRSVQQKYNRMSCDVVLGKTGSAAATASRAPIRPRF